MNVMVVLDTNLIKQDYYRPAKAGSPLRCNKVLREVRKERRLFYQLLKPYFSLRTLPASPKFHEGRWLACPELVAGSEAPINRDLRKLQRVVKIVFLPIDFVEEPKFSVSGGIFVTIHPAPVGAGFLTKHQSSSLNFFRQQGKNIACRNVPIKP